MRLTIDPVIYQLQTYGGVKRVFDETLPRMCQQRDQLHITLLKDDRYGEYKSAPPEHACISEQTRHEHKSWRIPLKRPYRLWRGLERLYRFLITRPYHYQTRDRIWHSTYFTLPPYGWGGKQVVVVYDLIYFLYRDHYNRPVDEQVRKQQTQAVRHADAIICCSHTTARDLQRLLDVDETRLHVIYYAAKSTFRVIGSDVAKQIMPQPTPFVLYVGGRGMHKNFDGLLRVYSQWGQRDKIKLVVVGQPLTAGEQELIALYDVQGDVEVLSGLDDEQLCALYNQAAAFVYPSHYEGFGIPLLEAMRCACPVVASRIPTSVEVGSTFPYYFELDDDQTFLVALDQAANTAKADSRIRQAIGYAEQFSWDKTTQATLNMFASLIN